MRFFLALLVLALLPEAAAATLPISPAGAVICDGALEHGADPDLDESACERIPSTGIDPQDRQIWVRMAFEIDDPATLADRPLGVFTFAMAAREIWLNGQLLGAVGIPGADAAAETPGLLDAVTYLPPGVLREGRNVLALRMSTFHNPLRVASPVHVIAIATYGPANPSTLVIYGPALPVAGILVLALLYFGIAFISNPREWGSLLIALMAAFATAQLAFEILRGLVPYDYPFHVWRLIGVAAAAFGFAMTMAAFVAWRFLERRRLAFVIATALAAIAIAPFGYGLDGKTLLLLLVPAACALAVSLNGAWNGRPGAWLAAGSLALFIVLMFVQQAAFLDVGFYLGVSVLLFVFLIDQLRLLRRARQAEAAAAQRAATLELELLRRKIAPHFLMNTLNALVEWVESDPKTGVKMIEALADEFRLLAAVADRPLVSLGEELTLCRRFLEVMSYRVDRAFDLESRDVDLGMSVPPGIVHTLIENAFTHGRFTDGAVFVFRGETADGERRLVLDAPGGAPAQARGSGDGLAYVRARLEAAFGTAARLTGAPIPGGWRTVLTWPVA